MFHKLWHFVDYHQPDFYHFSQDSTQFVHWIERQHFFSARTSVSCLDLCAGCGVIGLELLLRYSFIDMDFCELQERFQYFFELNLNEVFSQKPLGLGQYLVKDFREYPAKKYDYIFCNPPYFSPSHGRLSPCHERNTCRFFSKNDWRDLFICFERLLKNEGRAFFLAREILWDQHHAVRIVGSLEGARIFSFDLNIKGNE